jgi:CheY-like chemotaxis protein
MNQANTKRTDVYRCPSCKSVNFAAENEWCLCTGADPSLLCRTCGRCFCSAPRNWQQLFWVTATTELVANRRARRVAAPALRAVQNEHIPPVLLLVDDDRTVHTIVERVLEGFPGTLLHAYDGPDGLRMARQVKPDLVLTDAFLPGLDGRELARIVKLEQERRPQKVVVMTALYKGTRYKNEAFRHFLVDGYLEKPITAARLRALVETMLDVPIRETRAAAQHAATAV